MSSNETDTWYLVILFRDFTVHSALELSSVSTAEALEEPTLSNQPY